MDPSLFILTVHTDGMAMDDWVGYGRSWTIKDKMVTENRRDGHAKISKMKKALYFEISVQLKTKLFIF